MSAGYLIARSAISISSGSCNSGATSAFVRGFASQAYGTRPVLSEYVRRMDNAEQQRFYTGRLPKFNEEMARALSAEE